MQFVPTYLRQVCDAIDALPVHQINKIVDVLLQVRQQGRTVFLCGNGGSAATASHMACDLAKNTILPKTPSFRVIALTDNIPLMTAWGNDTDYANIFAEQLKSLAQPGDLLIAISASGNSPNVLRAIQVAKASGAMSVGFTSKYGGQVKDMVDYCVRVPCTIIEQVEDAHMVLAHCIASAIRDKLVQRQNLNGGTSVPSKATTKVLSE